MAVVYRSDIKNVDTYSKKVLTNEVTETQTVIDSINNFVSGSTSKLEGKAWNKERSRFEVYIKALEKRKQVSTMLADAIKSADRIMETYIAGFPWVALNKIPHVNIPKSISLDVVDSGWIPELQKALQLAKEAYASAESSKNSISTKNKEGKDLAKAQASIKGYETEMAAANAIILACNEVIAYLEKLSTTDAEAYAKYSEVEGAIAELNALVDDVNDLFAPAPTPDPKIVYVPVGGGSGGWNGGSSSSNKEPETPTTSTTENKPSDPGAGPGTVQPSPVTNTVTTNTVAPPPASSGGNSVVEGDDIDDELIDEDYIEDEPIDEGPIIGNDDIPTKNDEPVINGGGQTIVKEKNNTLHNVGLGLAGAAVAGAVGYGAYKAIKKSQENNQIEEEEDNNDSYNDYSDDFEIKTNEDDKQ